MQINAMAIFRSVAGFDDFSASARPGMTGAAVSGMRAA
jgi:hypothetical protein